MNLQITGNLRSVADSAWVSTLDEVKASNKSEEEVLRVTKFLVEEHHTTPFECVTLSFNFDSNSEEDSLFHWEMAPFCDSNYVKYTVTEDTAHITVDLFNFIKITKSSYEKDSYKEMAFWKLFEAQDPALARTVDGFSKQPEYAGGVDDVSDALGPNGITVELVALHDAPVREHVRATWRVCCPLSIAVQMLRHRSACLSGDTQVSFDLPSALNRGNKRVHYSTMKSLYSLWAGSEHGKSVISNMNIRVCDQSSGEIINSNIDDIWETGEKEVFKVTLDNDYSVKMTKDHLCLTRDGWKTLEDATSLRISRSGSPTWKIDSPSFAVNGIEKYASKEWLSQKRDAGLDIQRIADEAGCSYHTIRKYLKKYDLKYSSREKSILSGKVQAGRSRVIKNKYVYTDADRARVSRQKSGKNSPFWKGGVSSDRSLIGAWTRTTSKRVFERDGFSCKICDSNKILNAHHIDPVWHNELRARDIENLITLCQVCHKKIHSKNLEMSFMMSYQNNNLKGFFDSNTGTDSLSEVKYRKIRSNKGGIVIGYSSVKSIEYIGREMTYDLSVSGGHKNFVANGFIVHNSFNMTSGRYRTLNQDMVDLYDDVSDVYEKVVGKKINSKSEFDEKILDQLDFSSDFEKLLDSSSIAYKAYSWAMQLSKKAKADGKITNEEYKRFREFARYILPEGRMTELYCTMYLPDFLHYLQLRDSSHAQVEHIYVAQQMKKSLNLSLKDKI